MVQGDSLTLERVVSYVKYHLKYFKAREMAQFVGLEFDPQNPCNTAGMVVHVCDPSPKEGKTGGHLELVAPDSLADSAIARQLRDPISKKEGNCYLRDK